MEQKLVQPDKSNHIVGTFAKTILFATTTFFRLPYPIQYSLTLLFCTTSAFLLGDAVFLSSPGRNQWREQCEKGFE